MRIVALSDQHGFLPDNGAVFGDEGRGANQSFGLQTIEGSSRALHVASEVVEIAFGNDAKRADSRQRAALSAPSIS